MKKNGSGLVDKAVVLGIALVFVFGAFIPAVNSQNELDMDGQSVEESVVDEINISEPVDSKIHASDTDGGSLRDRFLTYFVGRLTDVFGDHPIISRFLELFAMRYDKSVADVITHDSNLKNDEVLTIEESVDDLVSDDKPINDRDADNEIDASDKIDKFDIFNDKTRDPLDPLPLGASDLWWDTNWDYRKEITIDNTKVDGNQNNFPVLISLSSDGDLASRALDNGSDIVFTDIYKTQLNHEIELFNGINGDLIAWLNVPSLSTTTDTTLYMYYGNSAASNQENVEGVWDSNFVMVHHLNETSGMHNDSTLNHNNASVVSVNTQGFATGQIDGADDFDGDDDYITIPDSDSLDVTDAITISAWIYPESWGGGGTGRIIDKTLSTAYGLFVTSASSSLSFYWTTNQKNSVASSISLNEWQHITVTYDRSNVRFYVNGIPKGSHAITSPIAANSDALYIGNRGSDMVRDYDGLMDELRISNIARSAGWANTSFNNQNDTSTFYTVGSEENPLQEPILKNENPSNETTNILITLSELSFTLYDYQDDVDYTVTASPDIIGGPQSDIDITSGTTIHIPVTGGPLTYETIYTWDVNVTDGTHWTNETYSFTTISNPPPVLSSTCSFC